MKILAFIFVLVVLITFVNKAIAGDRYRLPKSIPTEVGVDAEYFEVASIQIFPQHNDSLSLKFVLAVFANETAKKELGFGQYEVLVASEMKKTIEQIIFPILTDSITKQD